MGIKNISVARMHLGTWSFNCHTMHSRVAPPQKKPFFLVEVELGGVVATAVSAALKALGTSGSTVGDSISDSAPGFAGKIQIELEAVRALVFCDEDKDHPNQQAVGWDYLFTVTLAGSVTTPTGRIKLSLVLPLAVPGDRQWCNCNADIDIEKLLGALPQRPPEESPATITAQGASYTFLAEQSHMRALAVGSVEREASLRDASRAAAPRELPHDDLDEV